MQGYIKLHRDIMGHYLWTEDRFSKGQAWIDLILMANHKDKKIIMNNKFVEVKRGTFITSIRKLSQRWQWHHHTVEMFLNLLESDNMITRSSTRMCTLIAIVNYEKYQGFDSFDDADVSTPISTPVSTPISTQCAHPLATNKNVKNDKECKKNEKNIIYYPNDEKLDRAFKDYIDYRKKIKAKMTDRAIELAQGTLQRLSNGDNGKAIEIINQSIVNGWKGLFELKNDKKGNSDNVIDRWANG